MRVWSGTQPRAFGHIWTHSSKSVEIFILQYLHQGEISSMTSLKQAVCVCAVVDSIECLSDCCFNVLVVHWT